MHAFTELRKAQGWLEAEATAGKHQAVNSAYPSLPSCNACPRGLEWELRGTGVPEQAPGGLASERLEGGALHLSERLQDAVAQRAQVEQHAHLQAGWQSSHLERARLLLNFAFVTFIDLLGECSAGSQHKDGRLHGRRIGD